MNMTREEAIEIVQAIKFIDDFDDYSDRLETALDMAIKALKEETICPILSDDEVKQPCIKGPCEFERPRGEWIPVVDNDYSGGGYWRCSECFHRFSFGVFNLLNHFGFCPNCGHPIKKEGDQATSQPDRETYKPDQHSGTGDPARTRRRRTSEEGKRRNVGSSVFRCGRRRTMKRYFFRNAWMEENGNRSRKSF